MARDSVRAAGGDRLFADDYSSTGQRAWMEGERGSSAAYWRDDYRGQLRFDSLLSRTLIIPDSHLFDGLYFLESSPQRLRAELGRTGLGDRDVHAFEIRGREETLTESLAALLRRPGHVTLNAFVFKSVAANVRHDLASELKRTPETELDRALAREPDVPAGVASVLTECLRRCAPLVNAESIVSPLEQGWRRWVGEETNVLVRKWPIFKTFDLEAQLAREASIEANMRTSIGRRVLAEVLEIVARGSGHRSDVSELIAHARSTSLEGEPESRDLELIDVWYSRLRYRALASRHDCVCALTDRPWLPAVGPGQALLREALRLDDPTHIPLPEDVLNALGDLDDAQFVEFVRKHRRLIVRWWSQRDADALHEIADALAGFARERKRAGLGLAQLLPATGTAIGTLVGGVGGALGGFVGTGGKAAVDRRRAKGERLRLRVHEAIEDRLSERR